MRLLKWLLLALSLAATPAYAATFVSDTFTDTAGTTLASHTGGTGATWTKHSINASGDIVISDANRGRGNAAGANMSLYYASGSPASADYSVSDDITVKSLLAGSYAGVAIRVATGSSSFYWAIYNVDAGRWELYDSPAAVLLGSFTQALTVGNTYNLKLQAIGTAITVYIDGVSRIAVTNSGITAAGKAGVLSYGVTGNTTGLHHDNFTASDPSSSLTTGAPSVTSYGLTTATVTSTAATGGTAPYTYQWQRSLTTGSGFSNVSSATSLTLNDTGLARATTYFYRLVSTDNVSATVTSTEVSFTTRTSQIVTDGDSITLGNGLSAGQTYPEAMAPIVGTTWQINNTGISGQTIASMLSTHTDVDAYYSASNTNNVLVAFGGTNDIYFNADASDAGVTTYGRIVSYCQAMQALGWKIVIGTIFPRNDFPGTSTLPSVQKTHHEARRQAVNALIRANWRTFADSLADFDADVRMGANGQESNATYFQSDLVHPTATGAGLMAARAAEAVAIAINAGGAVSSSSRSPTHY